MSHKVFSIGEAAERADELSRLVAEAEGGDQQPILEGFNKSLNEGKVADFVNSALSHQDAVISKASEDGKLARAQGRTLFVAAGANERALRIKKTADA